MRDWIPEHRLRNAPVRDDDLATGETALSVYFKPASGTWKRSIQIGRMVAGAFVPSGPPRIEDVFPSGNNRGGN